MAGLSGAAWAGVVAVVIAASGGAAAAADQAAAPDAVELQEIGNTTWRATDRVRFRSAPDSDAPVLGHLSRGDAVPVFGKVADSRWYAFQHEGRLVFIHGDYLKPEGAPEAPAEYAGGVCPVAR